jgi:hypothetical protein
MQFELLSRLGEHMQRVANLMQAGLADDAASAYRRAVRLARLLVRGGERLNRVKSMHPRTHELLEYLDQQRAALQATFNEIRSGPCEVTTVELEWSPAEIVEHLALVNRRIAKMLTMKIAEARRNRVVADGSTEPVLPTIDTKRMQDRSTRAVAPDEVRPKGLAPDVAWAELERASVLLRAAIAAGDGLDLSAVTHPHPLLGALSLYGWIAFVGAHGARHTQQMREWIIAS